MRFFPLALVRAALKDSTRRAQPGTLYIHPWELDQFIPDVPMSRLARLRTFGGSRKVWPRIMKLLKEFQFRAMRDTFREMQAHPSGTHGIGASSGGLGPVAHRHRK